MEIKETCQGLVPRTTAADTLRSKKLFCPSHNCVLPSCFIESGDEPASFSGEDTQRLADLQ